MSIKDNFGKRVAIVSHGAAIKFLLMNWCKLNKDCKLVYDNKTIIDLKSPSVIKLEFEEEILKDLVIISK